MQYGRNYSTEHGRWFRGLIFTACLGWKQEIRTVSGLQEARRGPLTLRATGCLCCKWEIDEGSKKSVFNFKSHCTVCTASGLQEMKAGDQTVSLTKRQLRTLYSFTSNQTGFSLKSTARVWNTDVNIQDPHDKHSTVMGFSFCCYTERRHFKRLL